MRAKKGVRTFAEALTETKYKKGTGTYWIVKYDEYGNHLSSTRFQIRHSGNAYMSRIQLGLVAGWTYYPQLSFNLKIRINK